MGEVLAKSLCRKLSTALERRRREDPGAPLTSSCLLCLAHSRHVRDPISINNVDGAPGRTPRIGLRLPHVHAHTCRSILLLRGLALTEPKPSPRSCSVQGNPDGPCPPVILPTRLWWPGSVHLAARSLTQDRAHSRCSENMCS